MARMPIAVPDPSQDNHAVGHTFEAPVGEGPGGEDLPALLGLKSISSRLIETATGSQRLSFAGPGGYEIDWRPGTLHFKLEQALSGHLMVPCDHFEDVRVNESGLPETTMALHAAPGASSSSQ